MEYWAYDVENDRYVKSVYWFKGGTAVRFKIGVSDAINGDWKFTKPRVPTTSFQRELQREVCEADDGVKTACLRMLQANWRKYVTKEK